MREHFIALASGVLPQTDRAAKAFTFFKIPHLSASTPVHRSGLRRCRKTMAGLELDFLSPPSPLLGLLWGHTDPLRILATD